MINSTRILYLFNLDDMSRPLHFRLELSLLKIKYIPFLRVIAGMSLSEGSSRFLFPWFPLVTVGGRRTDGFYIKRKSSKKVIKYFIKICGLFCRINSNEICSLHPLDQICFYICNHTFRFILQNTLSLKHLCSCDSVFPIFHAQAVFKLK